MRAPRPSSATVPARIVAVVAACATIASPARSKPLHFGPHDVASLFTISKSENRNEVVYAIHLDANCEPIGDAPVYAFWRMHEDGPNVVAPLLPREESAYGIASQRVLAHGAGGGRVDLALRALPSRSIELETKPLEGRCEAWSQLRIAGERSYLYNIYVKVRLLGVDYLLLSGWAIDRTRVLHEKIVR